MSRSASRWIGNLSRRNLLRGRGAVAGSLATASALRGFPEIDVKLADGAGKPETQIYGGICHTTRYITVQPPLPSATWEAEVQKMVKTFGATIPEADTQKNLQYLREHYTPETRKQ